MTETDRELLELAAKANRHGTEWQWDEMCGAFYRYREDGRPIRWNTLDSNNDAFRLATHFEFDIGWGKNFVVVTDVRRDISATEPFSDSKDAALRRAITRAAAEIGRAMT